VSWDPIDFEGPIDIASEGIDDVTTGAGISFGELTYCRLTVSVQAKSASGGTRGCA
jgi:hypothetical protein